MPATGVDVDAVCCGVGADVDAWTGVSESEEDASSVDSSAIRRAKSLMVRCIRCVSDESDVVDEKLIERALGGKAGRGIGDTHAALRLRVARRAGRVHVLAFICLSLLPGMVKVARQLGHLYGEAVTT